MTKALIWNDAVIEAKKVREGLDGLLNQIEMYRAQADGYNNYKKFEGNPEVDGLQESSALDITSVRRVEVDLTGRTFKANVTAYEHAAGIGGTFHYALLTLQRCVLGAENDYGSLGVIELRMSRHDLERAARDILRQLEEQPAKEASHTGVRHHGD